MSLSAIADAQNAIGRLQECFTAELVSETLVQDPKLKHAIEIDNASFTWGGPPPDDNTSREDKKEVQFKLERIDLRVPRGQLVAIVGAVGSGKTSLLQGLIGDMRRTGGSIRVGGSLAYCSQSAWIQVGRCDQFDNARWAEFPCRMPPFARIYVSVGLSKQSDIGKPSMIRVLSPILTCCPTVT